MCIVQYEQRVLHRLNRSICAWFSCYNTQTWPRQKCGKLDYDYVLFISVYILTSNGLTNKLFIVSRALVASGLLKCLSNISLLDHE